MPVRGVPAAEAAEQPRPAEAARRVVGVLGELLVTAGVVVLLFAAYLLWWTGVETAQAQDRLADELVRQVPLAPAERGDQDGGTDGGPGAEPRAPEVAAPPPDAGRAYFQIRIPRLGADWSWVVAEGVSLDVLVGGPGHYPGSARPGEVGNVAIAGHRSTHGEPFADLDALRPGDDVVLEAGSGRWTYVVSDTFVTDPDDTAVVAPLPGEPGARPRQAWLTLTTCEPRWGSERRLVVHAVLESRG